MALADLKGRSAEELIVLACCLISLCGQIPFAIYRALQGDWAIVGVDLFGAALCTYAFIKVYRERRVGVLGLALAVAAIVGVMVIVARQGMTDVHFLYPVIIVAYFLIPPLGALVLSLLSVGTLVLLFVGELPHFYLIKIAMSIIGCSVFAFTFATMRNRQSETLLRLSTRDGLTGVYNRRALDEQLNHFIRQAKRQPAEAVIILLDLDNFKDINDVHGHGEGDAALQRVAQSIAQRIRVTDSLFRYGGDEFVVLAMDTGLEQALRLAEDIRARVEASEALAGSELSISLGVAAYTAGKTAAEWLQEADSALLQAKRSGRNQVVGREGRPLAGGSAAGEVQVG